MRELVRLSVLLILPGVPCFPLAEYWEKAEFPFEVVPKLKQLGIGGGTIKGYGCAVSCTATSVPACWLVQPLPLMAMTPARVTAHL